jgi:hypothetical protein
MNSISKDNINISYLERQFCDLWEYYYPNIDLEAEFRFCDKRKFRFDFAHPETKTAIEINGGRWFKSGHSSGKGLKRDYEKINLAILDGWVVFQLCDDMVNINWLENISNYIISNIRAT